MSDYQLGVAESRFAEIIWEKEPLSSGELVKLSEEKLGWKKSTTYTTLKRLCEKEVLKNENSTVTALISRAEAEKYRSSHIVNEAFDGSLPKFIAAFMQDKKLTQQEAEALKAMIDNYRE